MEDRGLLSTLRSIKHIEWIVVVLIVGAVVYFIATWLPGGDQGPAQAATAPTPAPQPLEARMEAALSLIEGAGQVRVLVNGEAEASVTGVIVVAQGADDLAVRLELMRAVHSLLDVPQSNIEVFKMAGESEE